MSLLIAFLAVPCVAFAHPEGHDAQAAWTGFLHPFSGMDHVLAMIAVGLWAVQLGRAAVWALPATFPLAMVGGALLARAAVPLPAIEAMIALSVMAMGTAVALGVRLPLVVSSMLIALFAIFHGYAHAVEGPSGVASLAYATGFVVATVTLHACGIIGGMLMAGQRMQGNAAMRISGAMIAVTGTVLFVF
jgi:urease accessory protein